MTYFEENFNKLEDKVKEWYLNDSSDIISALTIGYNIITSKQYKITKEGDISNLQDELLRLEDELSNERDKYNELQNKTHNDNKKVIDTALEQSMGYVNKHIDSLTEFNTGLKEQNNNLQLNLKLKEDELNDLKCRLSTSKTKGEMTEKNIKQEIESFGYRCEKPGINSGDLFVYSKENEMELVCVLEIKNYGEDNKSKLGLNGSETKKMYNDIETQLNSETPINVPWLFISLGCEIPKVDELRKTHLGIKCIYLSIPTNKELKGWIDSCEIIRKLNNNKNDVNIVYIQQKINEIEEIFSKLSNERPSFKQSKEYINKLNRSLEREENKFNKLVEDSVNRMSQIIKSIRMSDDNSYDNDLNLMLNIDELPHVKTKEYVKQLQSYSMNLLDKYNSSKINNEDNNVTNINNEEDINIINNEDIDLPIISEISEINNEIKNKSENKIECNICGAHVRHLKKHQKTTKCKNHQLA